MIRIGGNEISAVRYGARVMTAIYKGGVLVWQAISSCFGGGSWSNDKAWSDTDGWKV